MVLIKKLNNTYLFIYFHYGIKQTVLLKHNFVSIILKKLYFLKLINEILRGYLIY
jgi:hypothetical protein